MEIKMSDIISFLKTLDYDINDRGSKMLISDKSTMKLLISIEKYELIQAIKKRK